MGERWEARVQAGGESGSSGKHTTERARALKGLTLKCQFVFGEESVVEAEWTLETAARGQEKQRSTIRIQYPRKDVFVQEHLVFTTSERQSGTGGNSDCEMLNGSNLPSSRVSCRSSTRKELWST